MKKKILVLLGAVLVFGLAFAAYALNNSSTSNAAETVASCCGKGDSCPMKNKDASASKAGGSAACDCSCCKDGKGEHANCTCCGDSCPMKGADAKHADMKMADGESCAMMKGEAAGHNMQADGEHKMPTDGKGCCCACCKKDKAAKVAPPVV